MDLKLFRIHAKNMGEHYDSAPYDTYYKTERLKPFKNYSKRFWKRARERTFYQKFFLAKSFSLTKRSSPQKPKKFYLILARIHLTRGRVCDILCMQFLRRYRDAGKIDYYTAVYHSEKALDMPYLYVTVLPSRGGIFLCLFAYLMEKTKWKIQK